MSFGVGLGSTLGSVTSGGAPPDLVDPVLQSIVIAADGMSADWSYDENLNESSVPATGAFSMSSTSLSASVNSVAINDAVVTTGFNRPVLAWETGITFSYTAGGSPIEDLDGNNAPNETNHAATNGSGVYLEAVVDTFLTTTTQNTHVTGTSITWIVKGAGGGGDGDNETGEGASGGGGESSTKTVANASSSYTFTPGTAGAAGLLGVGCTNGGDSTVTDAGGTVAVAKGGSKGVAGNPTGTAGAGGTGGTGDTLFAGGAGVTGIGNLSGGGSGGSTSAGSTSTPGSIEGVPGHSATNAGMPSAGGGCRSTGTALAGGAGWAQCKFFRSVTNTYPRADAIILGRDTANTTSRTITKPGTFEANDRILIFGGVDGAQALSSMSGYTELCDIGSGSAAALLIYAINATDSESYALLTASELTVYAAFRIRNSDPVANWGITSQTTSTTNTNPPSHTHPGGSKPILWFTAVAYDGTTNIGLSTTPFPSGWDSQRIWIPHRSTGLTAPGIMIAAIKETNSAKDPGQFTHSTGFPGGVATMSIPALGS